MFVVIVGLWVYVWRAKVERILSCTFVCLQVGV